MGKQRKTCSTEVKEAIILSVLRGELGVAETACQPRVLGDQQAPKKMAKLWAAIFRHTWARIDLN